MNNTEYKGSGVILCIIDTGIDWKHKDFRAPSDTTQSRILYIWDQTLSVEGIETTPEDRDGINYSGLNYGVEYSNIQIENEIDGSPAGFVRESDTNGHGTHVAGTAGGNGSSLTTGKYQGMASEADILIVKSGNGSFPTSNLIDALAYAQQVAAEQGKAIVVNMSLGGHANAHDGTRSLDTAVDDFAGTGRATVISAGNEGDNAIHITGSVGTGSSVDISFSVPVYTPNTDADNDYFGFDFWFDTNGDVTAQVTSPNSYTATQSAGTASTTETNDGSIYLYNYININNSDREIYSYIDDNNATYPPANGTWTLNIQNNSGTNMTYHGWLFDSSMGASLISGDTDYTVGSPGTANEAITVGSYVSRWRWSDYNTTGYWYGNSDLSDDISSYSSIGPTRDGRQKPDITAPGQGVASSTSSDYTPSSSKILPGSKHHINQGTSMSCPVTAGCAALLLEIDPDLDAVQIKSLITSTALTDTYTGGSLPDYTWGYGKLDIYRAAEKALDSGSSKEREILAYDEWAGDVYDTIGQDVKIAVKFTPSISCRVTGVFFHPYLDVSLSDSLYCEVWSDNGSGLPNTKLGNTVGFDHNTILPFSWNFVDLSRTGATVTAATNYHIILYYNSGTNIDILCDNGSIDYRSSYDAGGGWTAYNGGDFRIRPVISSDQGALLAVKVFLEGPYDANNNEMTTYLYTNGVIPLTSPYSEDPRSVTSIPADITDWVLIQLRSAKTGPTVISRSAFLHKDGRIVADNGTTGQITVDISNGSYYIIIKQRNHLAVMSDETHTLSNSNATVYDFTDGLDKYEGNYAALLETGVYGMFAGDADGDGYITAMDKNEVWVNQNGTWGYYSGDLNLDYYVNAMDKNEMWVHNNGKWTLVPSN
ncbi:MAG: S8 family serine peptidase [bacterium]